MSEKGSLCIAFDARPVIACTGGLRRYAVELLRALSQLPEIELLAWLAGWNVPALSRGVTAELCALGADVPIYGTRFPGKLLYTPFAWRLWQHWPRMLWPRLLPKKIVLYHASHWPLPLDRDIPMILTIHDLIGLAHPNWVTPQTRALLHFIAALAPQARHIITDSEATKADVLRFCRVPPERITTVPLGCRYELFGRPVTEEEKSAAAERLGLMRPYFISVGTIEPRRNTIAVLEAYERLCARHGTEWSLLLVGQWAWPERTPESLFVCVRQGHLVWRPDLSDAELVPLLAGAVAAVQISLAEGFGLPLLEAMAAGCPVIASNVSALPEVAGEAALLVDPHDIAAIAEAMERIASDATFAEALRAKGRARAQRFTWEETARRTLDVYRRLLE